MTAPVTAEKRSFSSFKFDWIKALGASPNIDARAKIIGICILGHINQNSHEAILSDRTISDETAIPLRGIVRGRASLRQHAWIDWRRTGGANVYRLLSDPMLAAQSRLARLKLRRDADAKSQKATRRVTPSMTERGRRVDTPPVAERKDQQPRKIGQIEHRDTPTVAEHVQPPVADKHLSVTPSSTPIIPPRFARRPLRGPGLEEEKGDEAITIDQWLATTTDDERFEELEMCVLSLDLTEQQLSLWLDEFLTQHRRTNVRSDRWAAVCCRWLRNRAGWHDEGSS